jgi:pyruvyl transferase EpsO
VKPQFPTGVCLHPAAHIYSDGFETSVRPLSDPLWSSGSRESLTHQAQHTPHHAQCFRTDFVSNLRERIGLALEPHLPPRSRCALIDFKNSSNVGDSAIWLGQTSYLRKANVSVVYSCDVESYSEQQLRARLDGGIILISGGGNLGDLYSPHQRLREQLIERFHDTRSFSCLSRSRSETSRISNAPRQYSTKHPDLTLLARDKLSLEVAGNEFRARSKLCPDMAFALGKLSPRALRIVMSSG